MLLAIDIGNTNIVLATFDGEVLTNSWRMRTHSQMTGDELALKIRGLLCDAEPQLTGIVACTTVPGLLRELRSMSHRYYSKLNTVIVESGTQTHITLEYDYPREVGADRVVNTAAAYHLYGGPALVVDLGTSINFDTIGDNGQFLGGALAPGIEISVDALASRAAQLSKIQLIKPQKALGKNTVNALQSGIIFGFAGLIDGIAERIVAEIEPEFGPVKALIATGGLANLVQAESRMLTHYEPNLTLIGLATHI